MISKFKPLLLSFALSAASQAQESETYDLVIYGGTSAAVSAAVQAKRMNKSVIIVSPDIHLGGLSSGGLGWTDSGRKEAIGGVSREFYQRVKKHYDDPKNWKYADPEKYSRYRKDEDAIWVFEPSVAEAVFDGFVSEYKIPVVRDAWLDRKEGVKMDGKRITSITTLNGKTYRGRIFMDATYEGDLMATAGVSYTVGREPNAKYGETLNGIQKVRTTKHQFDYPVSAYVVPGDPSSGLLPRISPDPPGTDGEGDHRVQAYNFRMCLTQVEENRLPFPKPDGYDPKQYTLAARYLQGGWRAAFKKFDLIPNGKTDTNNHGAFSTDNIGMNYDYPDGSYERRKEIIAEHELYQKGLMYFLANDPSVPEDIRTQMSSWGLAKDEFTDNDNWPHQIYVREARRLVTDFVMTENHLRALRPTPESIGMGSYNMDSHNVQRYVDENGNARNEGDIQVSPGGPYPISYRAIVPKSDECKNLLVPVCVSSSHIAFGSIRMEPVFMILGQSAATAASIAIDEDISVQEVDYAKLQPVLIRDKQVLQMDRKPRLPAVLIKPDSLPGIVLDDSAGKTTGDWGRSGSVSPYIGPGYLHDNNAEKGKKSIRFEVELKPGRYQVGVSSVPHSNRSTNAPVRIEHADGVSEVKIDQRATLKKGELFTVAGTYRFEKKAVIEVSNTGTESHVIVDGVQLLPIQD